MKMEKIIGISLLSVLTLFSITRNVSAEQTSDATITFTVPEDVPTVLDPTDPEESYDSDSGVDGDPQDDPTNESGPLTLDYVSSIGFGDQPIEAQTEIYESTTLRPFIQVSDRRGTGAGWNVTAQMSSFTHEEEDTLPGSVLTFSNGEVASTSTSDEPTPNDRIVLSPGEDAVNVVTAETNTGVGSWITRWFPTEEADENLNDNVTLEIPAGAATQGNHTATITWTLTSGPGVQDE